MLPQSVKQQIKTAIDQDLIRSCEVSASVDSTPEATLTVLLPARPRLMEVTGFGDTERRYADPVYLASGFARAKEQKMNNKAQFYVGKPIREQRPGWVKNTLQEAIEHAKQRCEETGEEQIVVKVIRRIRRKPQPIVVETLK